MPVLDAEVARLFLQVADLLEFENENAFRIRAYRDAARAAEELPAPVEDLVDGPAGRLTSLPGIGVDPARRGRAGKADVANTRPLAAFPALLRRGRGLSPPARRRPAPATSSPAPR
jgi:helix-hairpin-helix protein